MMDNSKDKIASILRAAISKTAMDAGIALPDDIPILVERPKIESHGDWATNAAMKFS